MLQEGGFVIEERFSAWQKKKVKTFIVNAHSKSAITKSVATALQQAKPYDRIELTGGEYAESITLTFPVELVASEGEEPVILSRNSAVTITGAIEVYFERLTLTSKSNSKLEAGLVVMGGTPVVFNCKLSSVLLGGSSRVHIERCTIADSFSGYGLTAHDQASGLITGSSIYSHTHACVDIDTRGELTITECHLYNYENVGGDVVVVSSVGASGTRSDGFSSEAPCSHVTVSSCQIYVSKEETAARRMGGKESLTTVNNVAGVPCCVVISSGAAPTFTSNELLEGAVGFLLDGPGAAQLKGNVIRNQYQSGVLALVEEGYSLLRGRANLRIAGDNVIDRCFIGVDVQCNSSRATVAAAASASLDKKLTNDLPSSKRASHWLGEDLGASMRANKTGQPAHHRSPASASVDSDDCSQQRVLVNDVHISLKVLAERLRYLTKNSLQAYPTCVQSNFTTVSSLPPLMPVEDELSTAPAGSVMTHNPASNAFAELTRHLLNVTTSASERDTSRLAMMELYGNQGVDVVTTKFSGCGMCAIRFGRQGYGVVEDCIFEDCGTHGVIVDSGAHPVITGCRFARSRGAGILVGNFGNPLIIGNEITGGQVDGIELTSLSRGVIVGNLISINQGVGIRVDGNSYPVIAANAFSQNRGGGLAAVAGSRPLVLRNAFFGNLSSHILCEDYADALIAYNQLQSTNDVGIHLRGCARSTVLKNDISSNGDGILVELDADPIVRCNRVQANLRAGIVCQNNAMGTFTHNTVSNNSGPNVLLKEGASSVFRDNLIEKSAQGGVVVALEGGGWFERNRICANSVANVLVTDDFTCPAFSYNAIFGSVSGCGVICASESKPVFECNEIYENSQAGIYVLQGGQALFTDNTISREAVGILVAEHGRGHFTRNRVDGCYGTGVLTQSGGEPLFELNTVSGCQLSGIQISPDGAGTFSGNDICGNDVGVQAGAGLSGARLEVTSVFLDAASARGASSPFSGSRKSATSPVARAFGTRKSVLLDFATTAEDRKASAARSSACKVVKNDIHDNANGGILLESHPHGEFDENDVHDNGDHGILGDVTYALHRAQRITQAKSSAPRPAPISEEADEQSASRAITLRRNKVYRHAEANVFLSNLHACEVYLDDNELSVAPMGIYISQNSHLPRAKGNQIHHCLEGVYMDGGGTGVFTGNHIHHCQYTGVYVTDMAEPQWSGSNRVEFCGLCGVMVDVSGRGSFREMDITRCNVGIICFVGPATPFHLSYEQIGSAGLLSAFATFENNHIAEHDLHGVLVLSVIAGCPLRIPLKQQLEEERAGEEYFAPRAAVGGQIGPLLVAQKKSLCPLFKGNRIDHNRMFGVYHDRFEFWDFGALSASRAARGSVSPRHGVKNAYGGYEILLGTSQVHHVDDHQKQRQQKQISFVENVISDCSFGFGAGYGCHPFLLRNRIVNNFFFGLFLRFGSAVMSDECEISQNGLAGLYAANGAKGFIASGHIHSNNGLCRPLNSGNAMRDFNDAIFSQTFVTASDQAAMQMEACDKAPSAPSAAMRRSRSGVDKAYAQVKSLGDVHGFVMADNVRILGELVAASSDGMSLASGCVPSPTSTGGVTGVVRRLSSGNAALGGVDVDDFIRLCTSDGGIGVWIENGCRTTVKANTVEQHTHAGVLVSKGVLHHHRTLAGHFSVEMVRLTAGKQNVFAGQLEPPALASAHPGTLFTAHTVCATGLDAANQLLLQSDRAMMSVEDSFTSGNMSGVFNAAEVIAAAQTDDTREQRSDSIHFAHVVENNIRGNNYGVFVELYHAVRAIESDTPGASSKMGGGVGGGKRPPLNPSVLRANFAPGAGLSSPSKQRNDKGLSEEDVAIMESGVASLDHVVVVEGNNITDNTATGVLCQHIVEVLCGNLIANRSILSDRISEHYESVRSRVLLGGRAKAAAEARQLLFGLTAIPQKTQHAHIVKNAISKNRKLQGELLSRYVAITQDKTRTLLQFDTLSNPQSSAYCSQVLVGIPLFATLMQVPPPGIFLWDSNTISDSRSGVTVMGYFGSRSIRFRNNVFMGIQEDALFIRGHMACATVGDGNTFEQNGTAVHILTDGGLTGLTASSAASSGSRSGAAGANMVVALQRDTRTRIFQNFFKAAKEQALRLESLTDDTPAATRGTLIYHNEFSSFAPGTTAAFISDTAHCLLLTNVFRDSFCPVIVHGPDDSGSLAATTRSNFVMTAASLAGGDGAQADSGDAGPLLLSDNKFEGNYIGVLACNGATPQLQRNLFEANLRSGLEIVGSFTRPVVTDCVFRNHIHVDETVVAATTQQYASHGKVWLDGTTFSASLVPENQRILSPNSTVRLPAGVLLAPMAEALITQCTFHNNDIGVDAVRDALSSLVASSTQSARLEMCLFQSHRVAGVLVRGSAARDGPSATGAASSAAAGLKTRAAVLSDAKDRRLSVPGANGSEMPPEHTVFSQCYFVNNTNDTSYGDVITVERGFAAFRKCVFYGTVHGKAEGMAVFMENFFPTYRHDNEGFGGSAARAAAAAPAFLLHERSMMRFENNRVFQRTKGGEALPAADGRVHANIFVGCTVGLSVGPFCRAAFTSNRILSSKDCGVIAYGGILNDNEIFDAPTGVVVQSPNVYKGINAVPTSTRLSGFDLSLASNNVYFCGGDGFLVAGPGTFDGNYVSNCRNGFNVVCPAAGDGKVPVIKRNFVFDNKTGVILADQSEAMVQDNDIFDNDATGVLVEGNATGTLQANRISSAAEHGAMEQPNESRVKSLSNTIRNQFSPAFNRGVRSSRLKESEEREKTLEAEVANQEDVVQALLANERVLTAACEQNMAELIALHSQPVAAVQNPYAGAPSRAMRRGSVSRTAVELPDVLQSPPKERSSGSRVANRTTSFRKQRSGSVSKSSVVARKRALSVTKGEKKVTHSVLIHTFVSGTNAAEAQSRGSVIGNSVASVLASPPMSKMNLVTDVTSTTAQLGAYLETTTPFLVVVVVDLDHSGLNSMEQRALNSLEEAIASQTPCVTALLLPKSMLDANDTVLTADTSRSSSPFSSPHRTGGATAQTSMTMAHFASKHPPIGYGHSVDEVLGTLKEQITAHLRAPKRSSTSLSLGSAPAPGLAAVVPWVDDDDDEDDEDDNKPDRFTHAAASATGPHAPSTAAPPTTFSRERVSKLMSLLTPEALGYGVASPTAAKKRKSVVSVSNNNSTSEDTKPRSVKKTTAESRGVSVTGSAGSKRTSSTSGKVKRSVSFKGKSGSRRSSVTTGVSSPTKKRRNSVRRTS